MVRDSRLSWVVAFVAGLSALTAFPQDCPELVGGWPYGPSEAVAAFGDSIVFGSGAALVIVDVSNPASPQRVGEVQLTDRVTDVTVQGNLAYVANLVGGLRIIDVSTPSVPVEAAFFETAGWAWGMAFSGSHAYVADSVAGMTILGDCHLIFVDGFESGEASVWAEGSP